MPQPDIDPAELAEIDEAVDTLMKGPMGTMWRTLHHPTRGRQVAMACIWLQIRLEKMHAPQEHRDSCAASLGFHTGTGSACPWEVAQGILDAYRFETSHRTN